MRSSQRKYHVVSVLSVIAALGLWEVGVRAMGASALVVAPPSAVIAKFIDGFANGEIISHILTTTIEIVGGFGLGSVLGIGFGIAVSQSRLAEALFFPLVVAVKSVPKIGIAPLIVLWLGYGYESKVVVASLSAFFPLFVNVTAGLWRVDGDQIRLARSLNASRWQTFWHVKLPSALPSIFTGLEIAIVLSVIGAVVAEFISSKQGLGYYIMISETRIDTAGIFLSLVLLALLGVLLNRTIHSLGRRVVFWQSIDARTNW